MSEPLPKPIPYGAVVLRAEIIGLLDEVAAKLGTTREDLAEKALLTYLEDAEDGMAALAAEQEWEAKGRPVITLEELLKQHGLES